MEKLNTLMVKLLPVGAPSPAHPMETLFHVWSGCYFLKRILRILEQSTPKNEVLSVLGPAGARHPRHTSLHFP